MRLIFPLICLVSMLPAVAQAGDLLRIYELAKDNDASFNSARHARDAALESKPAARALLLPQLSASYTETSDDTSTSISFIDPVTNTPVNLSETDGGTNKNTSVVLSQPLFNLESWYRLQQADEQTALAELNYRAAEQALLLNVAEKYFQLLAAYGDVHSTTAENEAIAQQLELSKENLNIGLSSITDVQDVQARHDLSVVRQLDAELRLSTAQEALEEIVKSPLENVDDSHAQTRALFGTDRRLADLKDDAVLPELPAAEVSEWVQQADEGNFDVLAALLGYKVAERAVDVARSRHLPTVNATVSYTDIDTRSGGFPTESSGTAVGIGVTVPFYSGGATQSAVRKAIALRDQQLSDYDRVRRQADRDVRTAYQSVVIGAARIRAFEQARESSKLALEASQAGLEIGTRSTLDVLNAQQQRYQAERDYDRSRYDYVLAMLRLHAVSGRLLAKNLTEIDALLLAQ